MKKILFAIVCVCSCLFTAHAQVYDITFTREGATEATYTAKNTTLVIFRYNDDVPTVEFTSGQSAGSDAKDLEHTVRYNITFGKATSAINSGSGDPTTDNNGTVWAGAKPRKTASQDPQEPEISGPTLVLKTTGGYGTYTLSSENTTIKLKYDGTYYTVNSSGSDNTLSNVEAIYYVDPHRGVKTEAVAPTSTADGNIDYWTCSKCHKHFGDEACTKEVANNSWVRVMVSGSITWNDANNQDGKRPESVTISLLTDGTQKTSTTANAEGNWAYSFTDLPKYKAGQEIVYTISEAEVTDYTAEKSGNVVTYTHTHTHTFVPVMVGEKPSFTWIGYTAAKLNLKCSNTKCTETSSVDASSITSEITTQPTTAATGVLTHTATATYKETTYTGTQTEAIPQLTASEQSVTADAQVTNNSWTVINSSNTVGSEQTAPTITVTAGTVENPTTANIVITGENTDAKVNVNVPINATVNIYGSGNATIKGAITATGNANISGAKVKGTITANSGATVTLSNANVTSTTGAAVTVSGGTLVLGKGTYTGKEGEGAFAFTDMASITLEPGLAFFHNGQKVGLAPRQSSGVKGRRTNAQVSKSQYDSYTVCDANHTVHTYGADGKCTECQVQVPASMTLNDTQDPTSTLQGLIAANAAQDITLTGRTLYKDGAYNTLCLPFALTAEQLAASPLAGCTLKEVTGASLNTETTVMTIQLTQVNALEAGKPYLIKWESGTDIVSPTFTGVKITAATPSTISGTNLDVVGIFAPKTMASSDTDLFFLGAENKFYTSIGGNLKGYRCFFKQKSSNPVKALNFVLDDDDATSISELRAESLKIRDGKYLENGRVVIMRGGKKYNVNGQVIK